MSGGRSQGAEEVVGFGEAAAQFPLVMWFVLRQRRFRQVTVIGRYTLACRLGARLFAQLLYGSRKLIWCKIRPMIGNISSCYCLALTNARNAVGE